MYKIILIISIVLSILYNTDISHASNSLFSDNILSKKSIERDAITNRSHNASSRIELIITSIIPNPDGRDKKNTFIHIKNPNLINVNLYNWYIETRYHKYTFKNLIIRPNQNININKIGNDYLDLNNKRDFIKLFNPNGTLIQELSYKNAPEDSFYTIDYTSGIYKFTKKRNSKKLHRNSKKPKTKSIIKKQEKHIEEFKSKKTLMPKKALNSYKKELNYTKRNTRINYSPNQIPNILISILLILSIVFAIYKYNNIFNNKHTIQKPHQV